MTSLAGTLEGLRYQGRLCWSEERPTLKHLLVIRKTLPGFGSLWGVLHQQLLLCLSW